MRIRPIIRDFDSLEDLINNRSSPEHIKAIFQNKYTVLDSETQILPSIVGNEQYTLRIDMIGIIVPRSLLNGNYYLQYLNKITGYIHFFQENQQVRLYIHDKWAAKEEIHIFRIVSALTFMSLSNVFSDEYSKNLQYLFAIYHECPHRIIKEKLIEYILEKTPLFKLEIAMDFNEQKLIEKIDLDFFNNPKNTKTYYSKDYKQILRKSGPRKGELKQTQYSFVCIYDKTSKHGGQVPSTRLEFRYVGKYLKSFNQSSLALTTMGLVQENLPFMAETMRNLIDPLNLVFNGYWHMLNPPWFNNLIELSKWLE